MRDVSGGNPKLPQSEYLTTGKLPVVDQGQSFVAGYTNDETYKFRSEQLPVVVFGDHTKAVKFVDFPFVMGADGVKVLKPKDGCDAKYLYHFLRHAKLPDAGYSRHFKFLKELKLPLPTLVEQRRIAAILDKADALRAKRREAIAKLDQLQQSVFVDTFGDPVKNSRGWPIHRICDLLESVKYGSSAKASLEGDVPILRMNNLTYSGEMDLDDLKYITTGQAEEKYLVKSGDILFNRTNSKELVGKTAVYDGPTPMAYAGYLVRGRVLEGHVPEYISAFLNSLWGKAILRNMCKNIVGMANINAKEFGSIELPVPPTHLQVRFQKSVQSIREQKSTLQRHATQLDTLFASLQHRAFSGTL